ncbi:Protein of unknown function DUF432 [Ignisphaera aggregans DSM 17230]|uniref:DUF432 domain-containing protein n=1 Tax=Ignisphaera aggregans (strain DSM 17230 / JCM 13409 / AQ1.S1) TaxID=583356 RepID=E0STB1_IGNAA|nr:Protein of unknown function DUF432 [Ignisphaera aggregans DSM 17230]
MFGDVLLNSVSVDRHRIEIDRRGCCLLYKRFTDEKLEKEFIVDVAIELRLVPIYPVFYPRFITQYILCEFDKSIAVASGSSMVVHIEIPIDVAVYAYSKNSFTILDVLPLHLKPKLVLYGPINGGVLARYCKTKLVDPATVPELGWALSKLVLRNNTNSVVTVRKVLLDSSPLRLYYAPGKWLVYTQEITLNIVSSSSAIVSYGQPFIEGVQPIDDPPELRPPRIHNRTDMFWGY